MLSWEKTKCCTGSSADASINDLYATADTDMMQLQSTFWYLTNLLLHGVENEEREGSEDNAFENMRSDQNIFKNMAYDYWTINIQLIKSEHV